MSFAENLKLIRTEKGISQNELANSVGISQPMIAQYELGIKFPNIILGVELAKSLGTTAEKLVCNKE